MRWDPKGSATPEPVAAGTCAAAGSVRTFSAAAAARAPRVPREPATSRPLHHPHEFCIAARPPQSCETRN
jgi:hypothetical protein